MKRDLAPRVARWWIQFQEYDYVIKYRAGCKMTHADTFSRNAIENLINAEEIKEIGMYAIETDDRLLLAQLQDGRLKYIHEPVANTKTLPVLRFLEEIDDNFGYPSRIISDRGSAFMSKRFKEHCEQLNIKHVKTAVAIPRRNGQVERYNRMILDALSASISDENKWDREVYKVRWALNNTMNKGTGKSPAELLYGYRPRNKAEVALLNDVDEVSYDVNREKTRKRAHELIKDNQSKAKARYDFRRAPPKVFQRGDAVGVRREIASNDGKSKKLLVKFHGPYEIKEVLEIDRYSVGDIKGCQRSQKPYSGVFPGEKLKRLETMVSSDDSDDCSDEDPATSEQSRKTKRCIPAKAEFVAL